MPNGLGRCRAIIAPTPINSFVMFTLTRSLIVRNSPWCEHPRSAVPSGERSLALNYQSVLAVLRILSNTGRM
jgi:hypothetical protein